MMQVLSFQKPEEVSRMEKQLCLECGAELPQQMGQWNALN